MEPKLAEKARQIAAGALADLVDHIEKGHSEALTQYFVAMSRFRRHSWQNVLLITAQRPAATQVASWRAWRAVGRIVTRGKKGIVVLTPAARNPAEPAHGATGSQDDFPRSSARAGYVYDVSQTEGKPIPERIPPPARVRELGEQLRALTARRGIALRVDRGIEPASGVSQGGTIRLRPGLSPSQYVSVLSHELAREMLHHRPEAATRSRAVIEAQAEGVAYVVARGLGLETRTEAAQFMAPFCRDLEALAQTLALIHRTSAQILHELVPQSRSAVDPGSASGPSRRPPLALEDFDRVQRDYGHRLIESIAGFVRDRDRAEDLAARAFERAWEKRETFRGEATLRTWIEAIARNEARQDWSRARSVQFDSLDRTGAHEQPAPEFVTDELEKREDHRHLQQALAQLPIKYRRALVGHFVEGLSIRDTARRERVPEGTVLSRIFTGKQLLRKAWDAPVNGPSAKVAVGDSPALQPERQGSAGPRRPENQRPSAPEPMTWDR